MEDNISKIIVDVMPVKAEFCPFSVRCINTINVKTQYICTIGNLTQNGNTENCILIDDNNKQYCKKLITIENLTKEKQISNIENTADNIENKLTKLSLAIESLENAKVKYELKNENTGHIHARRKSDNKLIQYYANTGKIVGSNFVGMPSLLQLLNE